MFLDKLLIWFENFATREMRSMATKGAKIRSNVASPQLKSPLWKKLMAVWMSETISKATRMTLKIKKFATSIKCDRIGFVDSFCHLDSKQNKFFLIHLVEK
jgi:hypothetical protein